MIIVMLSMGLLGCGGMERINARRMSDSELRSRFAVIERELANYQAGETDAARLRHFETLSKEETEVERELYRRCQAGDRDACLPRFNMMRE
jgi:hypothetical protein